MNKRPNFLFVITDQHRADHLGCTGHPVLRTPAIDGLAARGVCHEACYVASMVKRTVDSLCEASGARSQFEDHPLQRFQRDINTLRGHVVFDLDGTMELVGRVMVGLPPNQPLV